MNKDESDEELMLAYQLGDENAFRELYARHSGRVFGFLRSKIKDEAKARDIFQSTFLKLHKSRRLYNPTLPFVAWLFTICRSEMLDALKKEQRQREVLTSELPEGITPAESGSLELSGLSASQKEAIELRFSEGFSFEEIARTLETSPSNARQIVSRAIRVLRKLYGKN